MSVFNVKLVCVALILLSLDGCKKEEKTVSPPVPGNEFLTTVRLIATNTADATDVQVASVTDTTLVPNPPDSINHHTLNLKANSTYAVSVEFLDETSKPAGDVTADIYDRRNYHLICFDISGGAALTVKRTDLDGNTPPLEIGLQDNFTTAAASNGILNLQLRHQPNAKNGSCEPGSSDADVDFNLIIK